MLSELRVSQLGVIEDLSLVFGPGMTALTGETGAGKTLLVEAVELLAGGRADAMLVRPGAAEAAVEGRFVLAEREVVLSRVVPADGRARAYIDGRMASASSLSEVGRQLVDLHGQHAHQSLFAGPAQRDALDEFSGEALGLRAKRDGARRRANELGAVLAELGGDAGAHERERQLLSFQVDEVTRAELKGPDEDELLAGEEDSLARAAAHRAAGLGAYEGLAGEYGALDRLGAVVSSLNGHGPLEGSLLRLRALLEELSDGASELRATAESLEEDPARLAEVVARRGLLSDLRRKYGRESIGEGLEGVLEFLDDASRRLADLEDREGNVAKLSLEHAAALSDLQAASAKLGAARRRAAAQLGKAVGKELRALAMPHARFEVVVGTEPSGQPAEEAPAGAAKADAATTDAAMRAASGEQVTFMLSANPGEPLLPLAKVASGGELARAMLALRLVLLRAGATQRPGAGGDGDGADGDCADRDGVEGGHAGASPGGSGAGPATLVFDEVDAGVGGEAALAVGRALANLASRYQVLVVTHLAQVAAHADAQVAVEKTESGGRTLACARQVTGEQRVIELSRMLSGQPGSKTARRHAEELLRAARSAVVRG